MKPPRVTLRIQSAEHAEAIARYWSEVSDIGDRTDFMDQLAVRQALVIGAETITSWPEFVRFEALANGVISGARERGIFASLHNFAIRWGVTFEIVQQWFAESTKRDRV